MASVEFNRTNIEKFVWTARFAKRASNCPGFDGITNGFARAMRFKEPGCSQINHSLLTFLLDQALLSISARLCNTWSTAIRV